MNAKYTMVIKYIILDILYLRAFTDKKEETNILKN